MAREHSVDIKCVGVLEAKSLGLTITRYFVGKGLMRQGILTSIETPLPMTNTYRALDSGTSKCTCNQSKLHSMELCLIADTVRQGIVKLRSNGMKDRSSSLNGIGIIIIGIHIHMIISDGRADGIVDEFHSVRKSRHDGGRFDVTKELCECKRVDSERNLILDMTMCILWALKDFMYLVEIEKNPTRLKANGFAPGDPKSITVVNIDLSTIVVEERQVCNINFLP